MLGYDNVGEMELIALISVCGIAVSAFAFIICRTRYGSPSVAHQFDPSSVKLEQLRQKKHITVAYMFYFWGGFLNGSHHTYLENEQRAMIHMVTFGFFGIGSFMDCLQMPRYVSQHNLKFTNGSARSGPSATSVSRAVFVAQLSMAMLMACALCGIPSVYEAATGDFLGGPQGDANPYDVLGVSRASSDEEIKAAFRKKSLVHHPDKNPDCTDCKDIMIELNKAYGKLKKGHTIGFGSSYADVNQMGATALETIVTKWTRLLELVGKAFQKHFWSEELKREFERVLKHFRRAARTSTGASRANTHHQSKKHADETSSKEGGLSGKKGESSRAKQHSKDRGPSGKKGESSHTKQHSKGNSEQTEEMRKDKKGKAGSEDSGIADTKEKELPPIWFTDIDREVIEIKRDGETIRLYAGGRLVMEDVQRFNIDAIHRTYEVYSALAFGSFKPDQDLDLLGLHRDLMFSQTWGEISASSRQQRHDEM